MKLHGAAICAVLLVGIFYVVTLRQGHSWGDDFSMYIRHAKNLVEGVNYAETDYIYNPEHSIAPTTYPPIFPLLLSPIYRWYGLNLQVMKLEGIVFFVMSLYLIFMIFKDDLSNLYILPALLLVGMNPFFWDQKDAIGSDLAFMLFTYLSLYLICKEFPRTPHNSGGLGRSFVIGLPTYLSYGTRSLGILLVPSLLIYDFIKNRWIGRVSIHVSLIFLFLVIIQSVFLHTDNSYASQFLHTQHLPTTIARNFRMYAITLYDFYSSDIFFNSYINILTTISVLTLTAILAVTGFISRAKNYVTIIEIFVPLYLITVVLWPFWEGLRFLLPVIPFYFLYIFVGINSINTALHHQIRNILSFGVILLLVVIYVFQYSKMNFAIIHDGIAQKESIELFDYVKAKTHPHAVFIFVKPRALSLFTGRRAAINHRPRDDVVLWNFFREIHATYLIVGPPGPLVGSSLIQDVALSLHPTTSVFSRGELRFLQQFVAKYPDDFQEVYTNAVFQVYQIHHNYSD